MGEKKRGRKSNTKNKIARANRKDIKEKVREGKKERDELKNG